MLGAIFGAAGQIAAASMQADAIKQATKMQIDALNKQRQFVYDNLNPSVVNAQAYQADVNRANNQRALQAQIDPALAAQRTASETAISDQLSKIGQQSGKVSGQATTEALAGVPGMQDLKSQLVDQAMKELSMGATLPPDVQAELVKAGLEKGGMSTGSASGQGQGGQVLRTILGTAGLQLKAQRQTQAAQLATSAQNLESSRQNILQNLFPSLNSVQLQNLGGAQSVLSQSNSMMPEAGLSGQNVANIWLARVGATNQLAQNAANAAASAAQQQGNVWAGAVGGATRAIGGIIPQSWNNTVSGWLGGGTPGSVQPTGGAYGTGE
jgi:hypothetical protein